jgi:hypothetical protein
MLHLVGVDHAVQYTNEYSDREAVSDFARFLKSEAEEHSIGLIAEEFSQEALDRSKGIACTCRDVAHKLGIEHRFCDPDYSERAKFRIDTMGKREDFWQARLSDRLDKEVLFVCGGDHVERFAALLIRRGLEVAILAYVARARGRRVNKGRPQARQTDGG